jgi:hypothetical protein
MSAAASARPSTTQARWWPAVTGRADVDHGIVRPPLTQSLSPLREQITHLTCEPQPVLNQTAVGGASLLVQAPPKHVLLGAW